MPHCGVSAKSTYRVLWLASNCYAVEDWALQRLFSTFPGGRPGLGLLLLRAVVGGVATALGVLYLSGLFEKTPSILAAAFVLIIAGLAVLVGFMTPLASLLVAACIVASALSWLPTPSSPALAAPLMALVVAATATGVALLGPGAFSLDGYIFGRREIVIPPRNADR
jgi:uncharacterized membrane protein YphA (DoxX/SURF4 family)